MSAVDQPNERRAKAHWNPRRSRRPDAIGPHHGGPERIDDCELSGCVGWRVLGVEIPCGCVRILQCFPHRTVLFDFTK